VFKRKSWLVFLAVIWIIIFAAPPLRSRLILMWRGGPQMRFTVIPSGYPDNFWPVLATQNPQNAALQFMIAITRKSPFADTINLTDLSTIDQLIEKYPNAAWLPALRLRITLATFTTNRLGGELSDTSFPDNLKAGKPSPEISSTVKRNFSNQDLQAALSICHLGEKSEPQNGYYNWIESCLYWMSWQDDKARQALHDGAVKSGWNNHQQDFYIATEQGYSQAVRRPLLAQEKILIINAAPIFRAFARYRENARILTWSAIKARRAGNDARALQTLSDTHHLMYLAGRSSNYPIDYLVTNTIMAIAENGAYRPDRKVLLELSKKLMMQPSRDRGLRYLVALAKSQQRPELAKQLENEGREHLGSLQNLQKRFGRDNSDEQDEHRNRTYFAAWYSCVILLLSLLGTIVLLILFTAGKYFLGQNANITKPFIGKVLYGALFSGGAIAAMVTLLSVVIIAFIEHADVTVSSITANVFMIAILLLFLFVLAANVTRLINAERDDNREFGIAAIGVLISVGVIALIAATWPYILLLITSHIIAQTVASNAYYPGSSPFAPAQLNFFTVFEKAPARYLWRIMIAAIPFIFGSLFFLLEIMKKQTQLTGNATTRSIAWKIVIWILKATFLAVLFSLWSFAIMIALGHFGEYQTSVIELLCCICAMVLAAFFWTWWRKPNRRASVQHGLHLSRCSLQLWICLVSIGILATLLIQISVSKPLQQEANSWLYGDMSPFQQVQR